MNTELARFEAPAEQSSKGALAQNTKESLANEAWARPDLGKCGPGMFKGGCGADGSNADIDQAWRRSETQERLGGKLPVPSLPGDLPPQKPQDRKACIESKEGTLICGPIVPYSAQKQRLDKLKL